MEASDKTPVNIGRKWGRPDRQLYSQFKQIVQDVNNFLIMGTLPRIKGYRGLFTLFYKLRKWLTINDLRKHTNAPQGWFTMW